MCDFDGCIAEDQLEEHLWRLTVERGGELDVDKGGYCDAKQAAIQFWCGPDDRPQGWRGVPINKCALNHPRALVGAVYTQFNEEGIVTLHWLLYPYEKAAYLEGSESSFDLRHPVERYGTEDDLAWCRAKFAKLLEWARAEYDRRVPRYEGQVLETELHCPRGEEHSLVALDPPFHTWEYYCLDCGALTCVRERLPEITAGSVGTILQAGYPLEKIISH